MITTLSTLIPRLATLEAKATKGPWHMAINPGGPMEQPAFPSIRDSSNLPDGNDIVMMPLGFSEEVKANAEFIALLRNLAPALLAERQALREALEEIQRSANGTARQDFASLIRFIRQKSRAALSLADKPL